MARTIQKIRLILFVLIASGSLHAKVIATDGASTAHRLLLFGSEKAIQSGYYALNGEQQKLGTLFVPLRYDFETKGLWNPYVYGCAGYGAAKYTQSADAPWMNMVSLELGAGVRYAINTHTDLRLGGAYQLAQFHALSSTRGHGYEAAASLDYHPQIGRWSPYLQANVRYTGTSVDFQNNTTTTRSLIGSLKAGVITPVFARPFGLPVKLELYGTLLSLHGDMPTLLGTRYLWNTGIQLYIQSPIARDWISDITLGIQCVRGENFKGFSVGAGIQF